MDILSHRSIGCIKMKRILYGSLPLVLLASIATSEEVSDSKTLESSAGEKSTYKDTTKMIYRAIFKQKRSQQISAAENILNYGEYSKQYRMVDLMLGKIFTTIQDAKTVVMASGYIPGETFPTEQTHLEAFSNILENTALFGDILLRLPDITHKVYSKSKDWQLLAKWSVSFCNESQVFDESDSKLLNLMAQELMLIPRDPNYKNPYRKDSKKGSRSEQSVKQESIQKKTKEKRKRGPRLSNVEL